MSFDDEMYFEDEQRVPRRRPSTGASDNYSNFTENQNRRRPVSGQGEPVRRQRPRVDENGNPIPVRRPRPQVDANGNPVPVRRPRPQVDENGRPVQQVRRPRPTVDENGRPVQQVRRPRPAVDENGRPVQQVRRPRPAVDENGRPVQQVRRPRPTADENGRPVQQVRRQRPSVDPERREYERTQAREDIRRAHQGRRDALAESDYSYTDMERRPADRRLRPDGSNGQLVSRAPQGEGRPRSRASMDRQGMPPARTGGGRGNGGRNGGNGGRIGGPSGGSGRNSREPMSIKSIVSFIVSIMAIICGVFFAAMVIRSKMLTTGLLILALIVCVLLGGGTFFLGFMFRKSEKVIRDGKKSFFITHLIVGIISILIFAVGGFYLFRTINSLQNMSGANTELAEYAVYVMNDNEAQTLEDASEFSFGILQSQDRENIDQIITQINDELDKEVNVVEYPGLTGLADAMISGEVDCMVMGTSFVDMYESFEGYETFNQDVRAIWTGGIQVEVETVSDELSDVVTLYISGSDTRNDTLPARSLSDVNIIVSANLQTHQILLVSTPRDYYVRTSVSGSARDKLTQAGAYGVQCSMDTLEMLYDIPVQYYARLNFNGFIDIIDAMGGITVHSDYTFTTGNMIGYTIYEGDNRMDGATALAFARERYAFAAGDNQRGRNQMEVIKGMIRKVTSDPSVLSRYLDILDSVENCFETSMPYDVLAELVRYQLDYGGDWDIITYSATGSPGNETTFSANHNAYVTWPDQDSVDTATEMFNAIEANEIITDPNASNN